jgi:hypothetical protein
MREKKPYVRPSVTKVRLDVKSSVLVACNTSTNMTPNNPSGACNSPQNPGCPMMP